MASLNSWRLERQPFRWSKRTEDAVWICNSRWYAVWSSWSRGSIRRSTWFTSKKYCLCLKFAMRLGPKNVAYYTNRTVVRGCLLECFVSRHHFLREEGKSKGGKNHSHLTWTQKKKAEITTSCTASSFSVYLFTLHEIWMQIKWHYY